MKPLKPDGLIDCTRCAGFDVTRGEAVLERKVRELIEIYQRTRNVIDLEHGKDKWFAAGYVDEFIKDLKKLLEAKDE